MKHYADLKAEIQSLQEDAKNAFAAERTAAIFDIKGLILYYGLDADMFRRANANPMHSLKNSIKQSVYVNKRAASRSRKYIDLMAEIESLQKDAEKAFEAERESSMDEINGLIDHYGFNADLLRLPKAEASYRIRRSVRMDNSRGSRSAKCVDLMAQIDALKEKAKISLKAERKFALNKVRDLVEHYGFSHHMLSMVNGDPLYSTNDIIRRSGCLDKPFASRSAKYIALMGEIEILQENVKEKCETRSEVEFRYSNAVNEQVEIPFDMPREEANKPSPHAETIFRNDDPIVPTDLAEENKHQTDVSPDLDALATQQTFVSRYRALGAQIKELEKEAEQQLKREIKNFDHKRNAAMDQILSLIDRHFIPIELLHYEEMAAGTLEKTVSEYTSIQALQIYAKQIHEEPSGELDPPDASDQEKKMVGQLLTYYLKYGTGGRNNKISLNQDLWCAALEANNYQINAEFSSYAFFLLEPLIKADVESGEQQRLEFWRAAVKFGQIFALAVHVMGSERAAIRWLNASSIERKVITLRFVWKDPQKLKDELERIKAMIRPSGY